MNYHYKKPGDWLWTPHTTESLAADAASDRVKADWRFRREGEAHDYTLAELLQIEAGGGKPAEVASAPSEATNQSQAEPKRGMFKALSIYLIFAFLWRAFTTADEYPSSELRFMTIALDLLCVIGLIAGGIQFFKVKPGQSEWVAGKVLFWIALIAGLGLFAIRLNGKDSSWTGHINYELSPRR